MIQERCDCTEDYYPCQHCEDRELEASNRDYYDEIDNRHFRDNPEKYAPIKREKGEQWRKTIKLANGELKEITGFYN